MALEIVPFDGSEGAYRRRVSLLKEAQPDEPWSLEGERASDEADAAAGRPGGARLAVAHGECLGLARFRADPEDPTLGRRRLWVAVAHRARRRGVGTALLRAVGQLAAAQGATEFLVSTSLAEPDGLAFALRRSFVEVEGEVELHLDLGSFDAARFAVSSPAPGLHLDSLASLCRRDQGWLEHYHRLYTSVGTGVLWASGRAGPDRETFRRSHVEAPEILAEGTAVAVLNGQWVGLCELWRSGDDTSTVYQELTGLLPAYRRQGIGAALVASAAGWARRRGFRRLLTSTGAGNEVMQGLAGRLGFLIAARWSYLVGPVSRPGVPSGQEVGA